MRKKLLLFTGLIICCLLSLSPSCQATTGTVSGVIQEKEEEIDALREKVRQKVEEKLRAIIEEQKKRGWVGTIEEKTPTGFNLRVREELRTVVINEEVQIIGPKREKLTWEDLAVGQRLIAMGYLLPDQSLEARRIILLPEKEEKESPLPIFGTIIDKSKEEKILVITPSQNSDQEYEIFLDQKTLLRQRIDQKIDTVDYENLPIGQKIIALVRPEKETSFRAKAKLILLLSPWEKSRKP